MRLSILLGLSLFVGTKADWEGWTPYRQQLLENKGCYWENSAVSCPRGTDLSNADLSYFNLQGATLLEVDLYQANLQGANLQGATLLEVDLYKANLQGADLQGADLREVDLFNANLQGANLNDASLINVDLRGANLQGANLQKTTILEGSKFMYADLRGANFNEAIGDNIDFRYIIIDEETNFGSVVFLYNIKGCMDSEAENYLNFATINEGCIIKGCTYDAATNYNSDANEDDGSCTFSSQPGQNILSPDNEEDIISFVRQAIDAGSRAVVAQAYQSANACN